MHVFEYSSSSCGLRITLCRRFQTTPFRGRSPAANARFDICYAYVGPGDGELVAPES